MTQESTVTETTSEPKHIEQYQIPEAKEDTDKFLKDEIDKYHDVKPEVAVSVAQKSPSKEHEAEKGSPKKAKKEVKKGILGLFSKKDSDSDKEQDKELQKVLDDTNSFLQQEVDKYHDVKPHLSEVQLEKEVYKETIVIKEEIPLDEEKVEDVAKVKASTDTFLKDEIDKYHDIRPTVTEVSVDEEISKGVSLVQESVKEETLEKSPKKSKKDSEKGGFLGLFKKSKDEPKELQQDPEFVKVKIDTFDFLKGEVDRYHDVRPIIKEKVTEITEPVLKETTVIQEKMSPKKAMKEEEKPGIFRIFHKKGSEEKELKRRSLERDAEHKENVRLREDTDTFLGDEIANYHDVRPIIKEKPTAIDEKVSETIVTDTQSEKQSPKKAKRDEEKTGILGIFKKKGSEEKELKRRSMERELQQKIEHEDNVKIKENTNKFLEDEIQKYHDVRPIIKDVVIEQAQQVEEATSVQEPKQSPKKVKEEEKGGILGFFKKKGSEEKELKRRSMEKELQQKVEHEDNLKIREGTNKFLEAEVEKYHDVRPTIKETPIETPLKAKEVSETAEEKHSPKKSAKEEEKGGILRIFKKKGSEEKDVKRRSLDRELKAKAEAEENLMIRQDTNAFLETEVEKFHDVRPTIKEISEETVTQNEVTEEKLSPKKAKKDEEKTGILSFFKKKGSEEKELKRQSLERDVTLEHVENVRIRQDTDKFLEDEVKHFHDVRPVVTHVQEVVTEEKVSPKKAKKAEKSLLPGIFRKSADRELKDEPTDDSEEAIKAILETESFLQQEVDKHEDVKPIYKESAAAEQKTYQAKEEPVIFKETIVIREETSSGTKTKTKVSKLESEVTENATKIKVETDKVVKGDGEEPILWEEKVSKEEKGGVLSFFKKKDHDSKEKRPAHVEIRDNTDNFLQDEITNYHDVRPVVSPPVAQSVAVQEASEIPTEKKEKDKGGFLGMFKKKGHEDKKETEQQIKTRSDTDTFLNEEVDRYHDVRPIVTEKVTEEVIKKGEAKPVILKETIVEQISSEVTKKEVKEDTASPKPKKKDGKGILGLFGIKGQEGAEQKDTAVEVEELAKIKQQTDTFINDEIARYHDVRPIIKEVVVESVDKPVLKETAVLKEESTLPPKPKKREGKGPFGLFGKKDSEDSGSKSKKDEQLEELVKAKQDTDNFLKDEIDKHHDVRPIGKEATDSEPKEKPIVIKETIVVKKTKEESSAAKSKKSHGKGLLGLFEKKGSEDKEIKAKEESEQLAKVRKETDTFLKDEIDKFYDVRPVIKADITKVSEEKPVVIKETVVVKELVPAKDVEHTESKSPQPKKREGKGILGWFAKKGSEEVDVDVTEPEKLAKLRKDTDTFVKDEIDKHHDVRPIIKEKVDAEVVDKPTEKVVIIKETVVAKGDAVPKGKTETVDVAKIKADTDTFLKDEIDKFHDVRPIVQQAALEEQIVVKEETVKEGSPSKSKQKEGKGIISMFLKKGSEERDVKPKEVDHELIKAKLDTKGFLIEEVDKYHDVRPVLQKTTEEDIGKPLVIKETILLKEEVAPTKSKKKESVAETTPPQPKKREGKGILGWFGKKGSEEVDVDVTETEKLAKLRKDTDTFVKDEIDKYHDVRPIIEEKVVTEVVEKPTEKVVIIKETVVVKEEAVPKDKAETVDVAKIKADTDTFLKDEIDKFHDVRPIVQQAASEEKIVVKEETVKEGSPSKSKKKEGKGIIGMFLKKGSEERDVKPKEVDHELIKAKLDTKGFLIEEVDKYHDVRPVLQKTTEEDIEKPLVIKDTVILKEEVASTKSKKKESVAETTPPQPKKREGKGILGWFAKKGSEEVDVGITEAEKLAKLRKDTDTFVKDEIDKYHDVRPIIEEKVVTEVAEKPTEKVVIIKETVVVKEEAVAKDKAETVDVAKVKADTDTFLKDEIDKFHDVRLIVQESVSEEQIVVKEETVKEGSPSKSKKKEGKGIIGMFLKKGSEERDVKSKEVDHELIKAKLDTNAFLIEEIDKYHDVRPVLQKSTEEDVEKPLVVKETVILKEEVASPKSKKKEGIAETTPPQPKKREGKGILGWFAKKGSEEVDVDVTETEKLAKLRKDTDTFVKDEIDKYHDVRPIIEENVVTEVVEKPAEKVVIIKETVVVKEEAVPTDKAETVDVAKVKADTDTFLKDEIDKFHDVRPIVQEPALEEQIVVKEETVKEGSPSKSKRKEGKGIIGMFLKKGSEERDVKPKEVDHELIKAKLDTDAFLVEEVDKYHDVRPIVKEITEGIEKPVEIQETAVFREEVASPKSKKKEGKGILRIFGMKGPEDKQTEPAKDEQSLKIREETSKFVKDETDKYHDIKPQVEEKVHTALEESVVVGQATVVEPSEDAVKKESKGGLFGLFKKRDSEHKEDTVSECKVTEGVISTVVEQPVVMRETIVVKDETQTIIKEKVDDGKGGIMHIFKKKSHKDDHADHQEHEKEVKTRTETDEFLKTEIDQFHDARPIVKETIQQAAETTVDTSTPKPEKREAKGLITKKDSQERDTTDVIALELKTSEEFEKAKSHSDSFLKDEVEKYHDAKPVVKTIEEKITVELEQPMVLEKTIIITETEEFSEKQQSWPERPFLEQRADTGKFLKEEVDRYHDVKPVAPEAPSKKVEDHKEKGGLFGFFKKKGSEDRDIKVKHIDEAKEKEVEKRQERKASESPVKELVKVTAEQQEKASPKKGKKEDTKAGVFSIFKKKGSEDREIKEDEQTAKDKAKSDEFIQGEVEKYHDVRPISKEKTDKEETVVIKDIQVIKDAIPSHIQIEIVDKSADNKETDVIIKTEAGEPHEVKKVHSKETTVDDSKVSQMDSPKPTKKDEVKGGLFGIFKKKDHKPTVSKDEAEENAKIREDTETFLKDEIHRFHDVRTVTSEGTSEKHIEKGVLSGLIKKGGGTDKETDDKKKVAFKEDVQEPQTGHMKRTEHLVPEASSGKSDDGKDRERNVTDEDFMVLTPSQVDSLKEIEIHRVTEEIIRVKQGTAILKTESIAVSSPTGEEPQKKTPETEDVQTPLSDSVVKQMIDSSDFLRGEVSNYEDARPIIKPKEDVKPEDHSAKGTKLFGLFSKKKSQDEPVDKEKTRSKKMKEVEATSAASESKDFSEKEVDRFHEKESSSGFFGLFSKKTKPQERSAKHASDALSRETLQTMKDSSDFLQNEVALYHDIKPVPDKVLTDIEIFEPIQMSPIDISEKTLHDITETNKFIHEEVDGIPEGVLKKMEAPKEEEHTVEGPTRTITYTTKVEAIPHGERTTRVSDEVITGTIQLGPEVLSDLTKLEEEINKKLDEIRKETVTKEETHSKSSREDIADTQEPAEKVSKSPQKQPSQEKVSEEPMFTKSGSPFKIFGRKMSEEEVKRLQEEEHSVPGTYKVKDGDQLHESPRKISEESLKKMKDAHDFLSTELEHYESGKPEVITDLDDEVGKSKSSGLFSIFSKKDASPKPTKKKVKKQKSGKSLDEPSADGDSKKTSKSVGIFSKIGEKITGKSETTKAGDVSASSSRESSPEKKLLRKDTGEVIKSLDDIQTTVHTACDETSSFAGDLIKTFEGKLDETHSAAEKQSEDFKKAIDEKFSDTVKLGEEIKRETEKKVESAKDKLEEDVDKVGKDIGKTAENIGRKAREGLDDLREDASEAKAAVASSVQNVEDAATAAGKKLQEKVETDARKAGEKVKQDTEKASKETIKQASDISSSISETKQYVEVKGKDIGKAAKSASEAVEAELEKSAAKVDKTVDHIKSSTQEVVADVKDATKEAQSEAQKDIEEAKKKGKGFLGKLTKKLESAIHSTSKSVEDVSQKTDQKARELKDETKAVLDSAKDSTVKSIAESEAGTAEDMKELASKTVRDVEDKSKQTEEELLKAVDSSNVKAKQVVDKIEDTKRFIETESEEAGKDVQQRQKEVISEAQKGVEETKKKGKGFLGKLSKKIESAVQSTSKDAEDTIASGEAKVKAAVEDGDRQLQKGAQSTGEFIERTEKSAKDGAEEIGKKIGDAADNVAKSASEAKKDIEDKGKYIGETVGDKVDKAHEKVDEIKQESKRAIKEAELKQKELESDVQREVEETKKKGKGFLGKLGKKFESAVHSTSKATEDAVSSGEAKVKAAAEDTDKQVQKGAHASEQFIERTEESVKGGFKEIGRTLDDTGKSVTKLTSEADDKGTQIAENVEDTITAAVDKVHQKADEIIDKSDKVVKEADHKQKEVQSDVQKEVEETKKKGKGFLGKLGKKIESAVSSTTKSVEEPVTKTGAKVQEAVTEIDRVDEKVEKIEEDSVEAARKASEKQKQLESDLKKDVDEAKKKGKGFLGKLGGKIESAVSGTAKSVEATASKADSEIQKGVTASRDELERQRKEAQKFEERSHKQIRRMDESAAQSLEEAEEGIVDIAKGITDFAVETKKEIEDRGRESGKAVKSKAGAAEADIKKSMQKVDEAVEQIKKDAGSTSKEIASEHESVVRKEVDDAKKKSKGFLGKIGKKLSGKKDSSVDEDVKIVRGESSKTGISGTTDQIPNIKTDDAEKKVMGHPVFREATMSDVKQRTIDFIESESLKVDDPKMTRTLSDYGCQMKEQQRVPGARKISEVNMDLSNLPTDTEDVSPLSDKAHSYVSSPTSSRRTHSAHFSKTKGPQIVELRSTTTQESAEDEFYIITEPKEVLTKLTSEVTSKKPLFHIESEEDDSFSKSEDDNKGSTRSNVLETLTEQRIETMLSDMTRDMNEPIEKMQTVIKKEEKKLVEHKKEAEADVNAIEQKLRDLDTALDSLEQIQTKTETITITDTKTEKKLKRVERKFEHMASEVLDKEKADAKTKQITSPEVEAKQETEFRELVSQLSTEEISDFQKEYSHLWDEHTFSKSSDRESKTPDSQADVQELPKGR
ncbi:unnamed protein product [Acanthoscelides obtectus]|uniref:Uncharacterized protein n=1 Tax=Acanthoscelides obtectus TaxID=200917 RepID=A0A9P0KGH3_ACAOB|nr:unnamed protein product [Acanthoscelides obtectus]CAK1644823.1 Suprabasin [Acanthoscelides obtectus]